MLCSMEDHSKQRLSIRIKGERTMKLVKRFLRDESGLESMEYAVLAALIVVGLVAILTGLQTEIKSVFTAVQTELYNASH